MEIVPRSAHTKSKVIVNSRHHILHYLAVCLTAKRKVQRKVADARSLYLSRIVPTFGPAPR